MDVYLDIPHEEYYLGQEWLQIPLKCSKLVHIAGAGLANLEAHKKGGEHWLAMEKINKAKQQPSVLAFFQACKPLLSAMAPIPLPLSITLPRSVKTSTSSPLLQRFREAIAILLLMVPQAKHDHPLAQFAQLPVLDPTLEDQWEFIDPLLNRLIGYNTTIEDIWPLISTGVTS
ncbi:hypothetical protein M422DRAFT_253251 [Sphaerobolus stellatus SS14]|uniref:Uncharacterized protein n=1 Tax=Sphaerobolus stellatus (strain SS14) TaxID=990650 RepID=A0A0C9VN58_SPHS4|nr:hypothetical protein M422DRAFT_253251 [Sphaerobolus stellatus SS14]